MGWYFKIMIYNPDIVVNGMFKKYTQYINSQLNSNFIQNKYIGNAQTQL